MQELIKYVEDAPQLIPEKVAGWVLIGRGKAKMDDLLRKDSILLNSFINSEDPNLEERIKQYKNVYGVLVNHRKSFTFALDNIKEMCMQIEKEYDPEKHVGFKKMVADELAARIKKAEEQNATKDKENEKVRFSSHIQNEYARVSAKYRTDLMAIILGGYTACLKAKTPPDQVEQYLPTIKKAMTAVTLSPFEKFNFVTLKNDDIAAIMASIQAPVWGEILSGAFGYLNEKFSLYANDLGAGSIEQVTQVFQEEVKAVEQVAQQTILANNLVASAGAYIGEEVKIKEKTSMKIADTDEWTVKVMSAFIANYQACVVHLNVKKLSNLNVGQMAKALDAAGVLVVGVEYEKTQK